MYIFAFNLYTQINLFIKHIFTNKFITIPYYIYTDRWSAPRCLVVAGVLVAGRWSAPRCPRGVLVVPGGVGGCHRWSAPRCLVVAGVLVVSVAYMQTTPRRARHEAPQRGGQSCF